MPSPLPNDVLAASPLLSLSGVEQAERIREGSLHSAELVDLYLRRIHDHNPALGAFVQVLDRRARREAERMDALRDRGQLVGPFHGVPTALKDTHLLRGARTQFGSRAFRYLYSPVDDTTARSLKRAGFVLLGKTATSELALLPFVETDLHPPARNPWDQARTAGGSSGGSGAAIAGGLVPLAPGSDGAGSIRIPSALCGLFGLKPSRGLVPDDTARIDPLRLTTNGPMARSIDDTAALLDVLAGTGSRYTEASRAAVPPLRIGVQYEPPFGEADPEIVASLRLTVDLLRALGHEVQEREPVLGTLDEFLPIYQDLFARIPMPFPGVLQPVTRWFMEEGRLQSATHVKSLYDALFERGTGAMHGVDVMLTPSVPIQAPRVGAFAGLPPRELFEAAAALGSLTGISNVTGAPALSVPITPAYGMPVGAQLIGRPGDDGLLLALGRAISAGG